MERYFVSYSLKGIYTYHPCNAEVELEEKISSIKVVQDIARFIEKTDGHAEGTVTILSFQRFDNE